MGAIGQPKTGGRVSGIPNKTTRELFDKCKKKGVDVFDQLLDFVVENKDRPELRLVALKELAQYLYPKRKPAESSLKDFTTEELLDEARQRYEEIKAFNESRTETPRTVGSSTTSGEQN